MFPPRCVVGLLVLVYKDRTREGFFHISQNRIPHGVVCRDLLQLIVTEKLNKTSMFKMETFGIFLISTAIIGLIAGPADGKQLIRLEDGKKCSMPGYYRDVVNCNKFYYCPTPQNTPLSRDEQDELAQYITAGILCPEGSIFDESISACNDLTKVKVVPPECYYISDQPPNWMTNTGLVNEITHN